MAIVTVETLEGTETHVGDDVLYQWNSFGTLTVYGGGLGPVEYLPGMVQTVTGPGLPDEVDD